MGLLGARLCLRVVLACVSGHLAGAFLAVQPGSRALRGTGHDRGLQQTHHVRHANAEEHVVFGDQHSYFAVALAAGIAGFSLAVVKSRPRANRLKCSAVNARHEAHVSLAASQALASISTATSEAAVVTKDLDSVETAMADFVPKIAALQSQAQLLRGGELSDCIGAMQDLGKPEMQKVFMDVDQVLCALVDAIQNLKKSAIEIRRSEIQEQVQMLDGDQAWMNEVSENAARTTERLTAGKDEIDTMMEVHVIGLSHKSAPVEIREKLAVAEAEWNRYSRELVDFTHTPNGHVIPEVAVISTCNRFEIYFSSKELAQYSAMQCVQAFLRHKSGLSREELEPYLFSHTGSKAVHHLFEVSSGLDSLVLGEAQILGQVRRCHEACIAKPDPLDESVVSGSGGKIIARMLNAGIRMGKLARTRTRIGVGAVSVSSAAVELMIAQSLSDLRKYPENLHVCIVGAGKMSRLLLLALFSKHPDIHVTLVNRSVENARALLEEVSPRGGSSAVVAPAEDMLDVIRQSDVVITATGSRTPIISADDLRGLKRNLMLVDIAMPRNIASDCDQVEGVSSYTVDDLKKVQEANNKARESEVLKAKVLIEEQAHNFKLWQQSQGAVPYLAALQDMAEKIRITQTSKASKRLKDLPLKERHAVDKLSRNIIDQLFQPIYYSMKHEEHIDSKKRKILGLKKIFDLEPLYKRNHLLLSGAGQKKLATVTA